MSSKTLGRSGFNRESSLQGVANKFAPTVLVRKWIGRSKFIRDTETQQIAVETAPTQLVEERTENCDHILAILTKTMTSLRMKGSLS